MIFHKSGPLKGSITVPGDKSISHRSIMLGALAKGTTEVTNFLQGADCLSTIRCFSQMGIEIENNPEKGRVLIHGKGLHGLQKPESILDVGNSGTTMRLLSGILCGQGFPSSLTGDTSIQKRPMGRIMEPLHQMGADILSLKGNHCAPLAINSRGRQPEHSNASSEPDFPDAYHETDRLHRLHGIHYLSPVASAQIKSCILLAGLYAQGETSVTEPALSRNHTELMLSKFGAAVTSSGPAISHGQTAAYPGPAAAGATRVPEGSSLIAASRGAAMAGSKPAAAGSGFTASILPDPILVGQKVHVPGDISSAAYFIAAGLLVPNSGLVIRNVGINPTRDGIVRVCRQMGADITLENIVDMGGEPVADLVVRHSELTGIEIGGELIPTLIDELPVIAVLACFAKGTTVIRDAAELKVKESNRIDVMADNLKKMGAEVTTTGDGMIIRGGKPLHGAVIESSSDHRIAMSFAIAGLLAEGDTTILDAECVDISYPNFYSDLKSLA